MSHWSFGASAPVVILGLALWVAAGWLCWTNWERNHRRRSVGILEGIRFVLVCLLTLTLLRPEFVRQLDRSEKPEIAILIDASGSMQTKDVATTNGVIARTEWVRRQREAQFWKPLAGSAKVSLEEFSTPPAATNTPSVRANAGTDLNRALSSALDRARNLKSVILVSDGDWNQGPPPVGVATRYREEGIPVFSVVVGRESALPDVVLDPVHAPAYGLLGEQIAVPFHIRSHLPREIKTTLTLSRGTREETRKPVVIPAMGEVQDSILWSPTAAGDAELSLSVPVERDEGLPENNRQSFRINVRVDTLKVLVVDSLPRWEYRYLRNALARDPGVEMNSLLYHPGMGPGGGRGYLDAFPNTKELLGKYDVVFLGDVGIGEGELSSTDVELLRGLVEQQGSGLVFLPGRRGRQATFATSPLQDLVPVVLDAKRPEGIGLQNEAVLLLSSVGKRHWLTRFDADESRNEEIWKQLPGFFWSAAVEKSRPGSEVLAVHSSQRNTFGRTPLLVTRSAGNGNVLFMGSDSAWRWRRGVEDKYHYRFWSQVVRWMAHRRHLSENTGLRLSYSPEAPRVGETVHLQATVLDAAGFPIDDGNVTGTLTAPSGRGERLEFASAGAGWGVFTARFIPPEGGPLKVVLTSDRSGRRLETEIVVTQPQREILGQPVNAEALRELATITQGASLSVDDLPRLLQQVSLLPEPKPMERRTRLWADPWWGGALLFLLAIYWTGRKLAGMI
jgi:hypothetical protein